MKKLLSISTLLIGVFLMSSCAKPKDISHLRQENAKMDREELYKNVVVPQGPLVLQDFLALGLMQNFDIKMKQQQYLVQKELATSEQLKMLPSLEANADWSQRSNYDASGSINVDTGAVNFADSISETRSTQVQGLSMAWNVLDFGITYLRSRQEMGREVIALQEYKRLKQNTILDITDSYWRSVVALKAKDGATYLIQVIDNRQKSLDKQMASKSVSEVDGLLNHKSLIEMEIKLQNYERELSITKSTLARLAGLPSSADFELANVDLLALDIKMPSVQELEELAFLNRPELFVNDQQVEIALDDVRISLLSMLPSANLSATYNHDNNNFLMNKTWYSAGINAAWDLFSLPQKYYQKKSSEERVGVAKNARLAMSIAMLSQVHLSYLEYQDAMRQYELAVELSSVKTRLLEAGKKGKKQGESDSADVLNLETEALLAQIYKTNAYSDLRIALERIANTVGRPLQFSPEIIVESVDKDNFLMEKAEASYIGGADSAAQKMAQEEAAKLVEADSSESNSSMKEDMEADLGAVEELNEQEISMEIE
jgi:outer membrane protein, multidrug efflux system